MGIGDLLAKLWGLLHFDGLAFCLEGVEILNVASYHGNWGKPPSSVFSRGLYATLALAYMHS